MYNDLDSFLEKTHNKKVICFGAGHFFEKAFTELFGYGIDIYACLDNNDALWGKKIHGIEIHSFDWIRNYNVEDVIILITNALHFTDIEEQIRSLWKKDADIFHWPLSGRFHKMEEKYWKNRVNASCRAKYSEILSEEVVNIKMAELVQKDLLVLPRIPVMLTTRCTLRCEQCNNLMPYYKKHIDYSSDEVLRWINTLLDSVDEWICIELVGGEPFLYKELDRVLKYVIESEKIKCVEITTNGMVVPPNDILELLQNKKIKIHVSDYGKVVSQDKFINLLKENGINYIVYENMKWIKVGGIDRRGRTEEELRSQYWICPAAKMCRTILNGKLHVCSRAASLYELGVEREVEYIDLDEKDNLRERLRRFLILNNSIACDYCDNAIENVTYVEPAVQKRK